MAVARIDRRIEQHQRVESPSVLERMHRSGDARQRMEQSGGRLRAELAIDRMPDDVHVGDEVLPRMSFGAVQRIVPVIAEVEDDHFVALAQRSPEWKVAVDREPVAVTEHEPRRAGDAVLANVNRRAVVHLHVEGVTRARHMMNQVMFVRLVHFLSSHSILTGSISIARNISSRSADGPTSARIAAIAARIGFNSRDFIITCHR